MENNNLEPKLQKIDGEVIDAKPFQEATIVDAQVVETQQNQLVVSNLPSEKAELTPQERQRVNQLSQQIPIGDSQAVMLYGVSAQQKLGDSSNQLLNAVKTKDLGTVGSDLNELMLTLGEVELDSKEPNFLQKIFRKGKRSIQEIQLKNTTVEKQVDMIVDKLQKSQVAILNDVKFLDKMYENNVEYLKGVQMYILAGEDKIYELKTVEVPKLEQRIAENPEDALLVNELSDLNQFINRLEKRVHDLELTRTVIIQNAPQIRLIQNTNSGLAEKIQASVLTAIPLWKNQLAIAMTLANQEKAVKSQQAVTDGINDMLLKNSESLKTNTISSAKMMEEGIVSIDTLKKTQENLIGTIKETINIQQQGTQKREQAKQELDRMEEELKQSLLEANTQQANGYSANSGLKKRGDVVEQPINYLEM